MALLIAILLAVFLLPTPWNVLALACGLFIEVGEVIFGIWYSRRRRATTGAEGMVGGTAKVIEPCRPEGQSATRASSGTLSAPREPTSVSACESRRWTDLGSRLSESSYSDGTGRRADGSALQRGDLDELCELVRETVNTSYAAVYPPGVVDFFHQYHERAIVVSDAADGHTIVVRSGGTLVATGTRVVTTVRRVFVRAEWQRRGIGRLVMTELEAKALKDEVERLDLSAALPALEFYLHLGYETVSEEDYEVAPGQHLEYYEMAKNLRR